MVSLCYQYGVTERGTQLTELELRNEEHFATVAAVLNTLEQVAHRSSDASARDMANAACIDLRAIVPAELLDAPRLTMLSSLFKDRSICELVAEEFPQLDDARTWAYRNLNKHGWTIQQVCESIPGTERSEDTEWISTATGDVERITYHFVDSSALHVYPTMGHWVPS